MYNNLNASVSHTLFYSPIFFCRLDYVCRGCSTFVFMVTQRTFWKQSCWWFCAPWQALLFAIRWIYFRKRTRIYTYKRFVFVFLHKNPFPSMSTMTANMSFRWIHIEIIGFGIKNVRQRLIHTAILRNYRKVSLSGLCIFSNRAANYVCQEEFRVMFSIDSDKYGIVVFISWSDGFKHLPFEFVCTKFHGHSEGCLDIDTIWKSHNGCDINSFSSMFELWQR